MLPLQLLRIRTRGGSITPLFCVDAEDLDLASRMIKAFEESHRKKERKGLLEKRIAAIESQYDDYKLVRGFYALLERRCEFNMATGIAADPFSVRKALFEESARRGFALTDLERNEIVSAVAAKLGISAKAVLQSMWGDLEENLVLDHFEPVDGRTLVGWYNLSLMQTLLFNCTKLDFYVSGGTSWKDVLRNVKRLGLMYNLQQRSEGNSDGQTGEKDIVCSLDGPMSLFKLTDRYGTSIAKLLPSIVSSKKWYIDSWIVRKTMAGRKIYQFKISDADVPKLLTDPYSRVHEMFDSAVEEKFASRFEKSATGWQLIREPDPIVVSGGKALIPDFMFEKYNKRVYLEIIGFWTKEYLERKVGKMLDVAESGKIDLFVAVNEELGCSKLSSLISKERLILYKGDSVPIKPILDYLKSIDREFIERKVADPEFRIELDPEAEIISINELARKNGVPEELVSKVASKNDRFVRAGMYLISKSKADKLKTVLEGVNKFAEACVLLSKNGIPEDSHADLVSKLGYSVMWQSMDPGSAIIRKAL